MAYLVIRAHHFYHRLITIEAKAEQLEGGATHVEYRAGRCVERISGVWLKKGAVQPLELQTR